MTVNKEAVNWQHRSRKLLQQPFRMLIGGEPVEAAAGGRLQTTDPATGEHLGDVPCADADDVNRAVEAAHQAFEGWRQVPVFERVQLVRKLAASLRERAEDFGILDGLDSGNPVQAMIGDVGMAATMMDYIGGVAMEVKGETIPATGRNWHLTKQEPYGVVGRIIPFNHPILFAAWKLAAPLVTGNTIVIKAAEQTPLSALEFGKLCQEILPAGVVNIITGDGPVAGNALVRHAKVKRLALTGSVETGQRILRSAAEVGIKHVSLELGGKNAMIVCEDADVERAVNAAAVGMNFHWCQGQSCGSTSRLFLHESIHDSFVEKLIKRVREIRIGLPIEPATEMGSLVSQDQYDKVMRYIGYGMEEGARLVEGGEDPDIPELKNGYFVKPTLFTNVTRNMRIAREEIFGPVLSIFRWSDEEKVLADANAVEYGLTGAVWTQDISRAMRLSDALETGYVWINGSSRHFMGVPFGGHKSSGLGTEECLEELRSYTETKSINMMLD